MRPAERPLGDIAGLESLLTHRRAEWYIRAFCREPGDVRGVALAFEPVVWQRVVRETGSAGLTIDAPLWVLYRLRSR